LNAVTSLAIPPLPPGAHAFGARWDEAAAQAACAFFPAYLRHTEGKWAGQPFELAAWQRDRIIRPLFGWKRADGTRLYRIAWIEVPRKNGKTELAAGIALLMLLGDGEHGGQVYSLATNKDQAKIVWSKAGIMAAMSPALARELELYTTSIFCPALMASFKPLSGNMKGKHGLSPTGAIGDEVHEWENWEVADTVHKGTAARAQPLEVYITTAGAEDSPAAEWHELAMSITAGEVEDPTMLVVIFSAAESKDPLYWTTEAAWREANPNYGISVNPDFMREECGKAQRSPRAENAFKRYHLNIWTEQVTRWLPMEDWRAKCTTAPGNRNLWAELPEQLAGQQCFGGLDLSIVNDLASLCWAFPGEAESDRWTFIWRYWLPRETLALLPASRRIRLENFAAAGALTLTEGNVVDNSFIRQAILADTQRFAVQWLGIDRFNAVDMATTLREQDGLPVEFFGQGFLSMNAPAKTFEKLVIAGQMEHGNNPVTSWMAANAAVDRDAADNIKPTKANRATAKVDGIVAAVMAVGGAIASTRNAAPGVFF
jgi:phage terminase large subunit-like protein